VMMRSNQPALQQEQQKQRLKFMRTNSNPLLYFNTKRKQIYETFDYNKYMTEAQELKKKPREILDQSVFSPDQQKEKEYERFFSNLQRAKITKQRKLMKDLDMRLPLGFNEQSFINFRQAKDA